MKKIRLALLVVLGCMVLPACAQQKTTLQEQLKAMAKERDPQKSIAMMKKIIAENDLDTAKDISTADVLKGNVALAFLRQRKYDAFKKYIGQMKSKFDQTSYMNMGASMLVKEKIDTKMAEKLAKETLDLYFSYKDDPRARPADMSEADWKRFMDFARYPYYDTYAQALFANGKYKQALQYQEKAFRGSPEEGLPSAVERYARLLVLNGREQEAYDLLLTMAKEGKATAAMNDQLKAMYVRKHGDASGFEAYLAGLQKNIQSALEKSLKPKMMDTAAPGFTLRDLQGREVSLSDFRGKVVVLDFWATWCAPCIASFPAMQKMVKKHPEVAFLFIATQEKKAGALERVQAFIKKHQYPFHVVMDEPVAGKPDRYRVVSAYRPSGIPAKAVIDRRGKLRFLSIGFSSDSELINELEAMIALAKEVS